MAFRNIPQYRRFRLIPANRKIIPRGTLGNVLPIAAHGRHSSTTLAVGCKRSRKYDNMIRYKLWPGYHGTPANLLLHLGDSNITVCLAYLFLRRLVFASFFSRDSPLLIAWSFGEVEGERTTRTRRGGGKTPSNPKPFTDSSSQTPPPPLFS